MSLFSLLCIKFVDSISCSPPYGHGVEIEASRLGDKGERSDRFSFREAQMATKTEGSSLHSPLQDDASSGCEAVSQERRIPTCNSLYE